MIDGLKTGLAFLPLQFSRNTIEHIIEPADTSLADRSGLRYYLEALVPTAPGSTVFKRLVKMPGAEVPPRTEFGSVIFEGAYFQLDGLLDGFLDYQKPDADALAMCVVSSLTMPYMLRESIHNNGLLLAGSELEQANQWLIKAGLADLDFAAWGEVFFTSYMSQERQFLTWQPDSKTIGQEQPEFLTFLLNFSPTPATIIRRTEVTYSDGTVEELDRGQLVGATTYQAICVPVGAAALGLASLAKPVASYRVWLSDGEQNRLSQVRSYILDTKYRSQERWILYANSLGGWDTLRLLGEATETLEALRTMATMARPGGAAADFAELKTIYVEGKQTMLVSTGFFERNGAKQLKCLDELFLSQSIYLMSKKGHQALELMTANFVDAEDDADLLARSFLFQVASPILNYSSLPVSAAVSARAVGWRGVGSVQILDSYGKRTGYGRPLKLQKYYLDDNSPYKPITEQSNQPGATNYIDSLPLPGIPSGSTPFPSQAISRATTVKRATCTGGDVGETALVVIASGKYGSEYSQADSDGKAEGEYDSLDTQAYADSYGACTTAPELYALAVPAGLWHYRVNDPARVEIDWKDETNVATIGNTWSLQGQVRDYVYARHTNDLNFPVAGAYTSAWRIFIYGTPGSSANMKYYQNGILRWNQDVGINQDGYNYINLTGIIGFSPIMTFNSGDKIYIKITQL